jgi:hypothetical protein
VGLNGFEPSTSPLSGVRSNQLSYRPINQLPIHNTMYHDSRQYFFTIFSKNSRKLF